MRVSTIQCIRIRVASRLTFTTKHICLMIQQCFFSLLFLFFFSFTFCCCSFYLSSCLFCFIYVYVLYSYSSAYKDHLYWLISIKDVNLNAINSLAYLLLCFVFTLCFLTFFFTTVAEATSFTQIRWTLLFLMLLTNDFLFFAQKYRLEKVVVRCLLMFNMDNRNGNCMKNGGRK